MKRTFLYFLIGILSIVVSNRKYLWAQTTQSKTKIDTGSKHLEALNQFNSKGEKQGLWYIDQKPDKFQDGYIAFGRYEANQKQGLWYRMDHLGRLIFIKNYRNNVQDGISQYYQNGALICIGNFRGLNPENKIDSFWVTNPLTEFDTLILVPSEKGSIKDGLWRYYNPVTGQLQEEEMYQVGHLLYRKEFTQPDAVDSFYYKLTPQHRPIDKKRVYHKVPERAKREIGY